MVCGIRSLNKKEVTEKTILIIPDTTWKFDKTDGYIEFCKFSINLLLNKTANSEMKETIKQIYQTINALQDSNVKFEGKTTEDFEIYKEKMSHLFEHNYQNIEVEVVRAYGKLQFENIVSKFSDRERLYCFYYDEESEDEFELKLKDDIICQLCNLRMQKDHVYDGVSRFLTTMGYHEHIADAMNILIQTLVYAFNCYSFKNEDSLYEDIAKISREIEYAKCVIQRIGILIG